MEGSTRCVCLASNSKTLSSGFPSNTIPIVAVIVRLRGVKFGKKVAPPVRTFDSLRRLIRFNTTTEEVPHSAAISFNLVLASLISTLSIFGTVLS
jgi:hypothetical protein